MKENDNSKDMALQIAVLEFKLDKLQRRKKNIFWKLYSCFSKQTIDDEIISLQTEILAKSSYLEMYRTEISGN